MKKTSSQVTIAFILLILALIFGIWLIIQGENLVWYWILGIAFGYVMQRSGVCFASSASEPIIMGSTIQFRSILTGILVASLGITAIKYLSDGVLDFLGVSAISLPLILGAFLFGIGMIIAGCCTSGMFIRLAEGFSIHIITLISVIIGYMFASSHYESVWAPWVIDAPMIFLPEKFGWFWGIVIHIAIILLLYIAAVKWEKKKFGE